MDQLETLTREQLAQIDSAICDFESSLATDQPQSIEAGLNTVEESLRGPLLAELIASDIDHRRSLGQPVSAQQYQTRFPEYSDIIESVFETHSDDSSPQTSQPGEDISFAETRMMSVDETGSVVNPVEVGETVPTDSQSHTSNELELPCDFGRYRIERVLGSGGMGTVYLALDTQLNRRIALKIPKFSSSDQTGAARFLREAQAMAMVEHPNLCPILDVGEIDGQQFLTMTYLEGATLTAVIEERGGLPVEDAVQVVISLAEALQVAHEAGIIHRDLKPSNVVFNGRDEPVVMDFGLARPHQASDSTLTREGMIVGSPAYMSPEQVEGEAETIGPQTDVYALGVILYELLSGQRPYQGSILSVLGQIRNGTPVPLTERGSGIDSQLADICNTAMANDPDERYPSAESFAAALKSYSTGQLKTGWFSGRVAVAAMAFLLMAICFVAYVINPAESEVGVPAPEAPEIITEAPGETDSPAPDRGSVDDVTFVDSGMTFRGPYSISVVAGDLDGDRRPDAVVGTNTTSDPRIYWNEGSGELTLGDFAVEVEIGHTGYPTLSDLDGDGDLDIFLARSNGATDRVLLNQGNRKFIATEDLLASQPSSVVAIDDLDGDSDPDVWVTGLRGQHSLWLNDGTGRFSKHDLDIPVVPTTLPFVLLADFDGDGDVDAFTKIQDEGQEGFAHFCWNDGAANFTLGEPIDGIRLIGRAVAGDFDQDGRVDIATLMQSRLAILRDRAGRWVADILSDEPFPDAWQLIAHDFNGDEVLDLAVAMKGDGEVDDSRNLVFLNSGKGEFVRAESLPGRRPTLGLAAADFDLDGDVDLFEANGKSAADRILWNDSEAGP